MALARWRSRGRRQCRRRRHGHVGDVVGVSVGVGNGTSADDHPLADIRLGERFIADAYHALANAGYLDKTVFIVTDSPSIFAAVAAELPSGIEAVRLYENYLSTFTLNTRRTAAAEVDPQ